MYKNILFDFDGTLADTGSILLKVYPVIAERNGIPILPRKRIEELRHLPIRTRLKEMEVSVYRLPRLMQELREACLDYMGECQPFEGISTLLSGLSEDKLFIGILSSNSAENINKFLTAQKLNLFDLVHATSSLFGKHKEIKKVLRKNKLKKEETLYIGDEIRDITACRKAMVKVAAVSWGYDSIPLLESGNPDYLVKTPEELLALIRHSQ